MTAPDAVALDAAAVHARVKRLALAQSADIAAKLAKAGVELVRGRARLGDDTLGHTHQVVVEPRRRCRLHDRGHDGSDRDRSDPAGAAGRRARRRSGY